MTTIYHTLDELFNNVDNLIEFDNKRIVDIIKDVTKMSFTMRKYKALVEKEQNNLLATIENIYGKKYKYLLENSKRAVTSKDLVYFINGDDTILTLRNAYDKIVYYKTRIDGVISSLDQFAYQINNITRLVLDKQDSYTLE